LIAVLRGFYLFYFTFGVGICDTEMYLAYYSTYFYTYNQKHLIMQL